MSDLHSSAKAMLSGRKSKIDEKDVDPAAVIDQANKSPKMKAPKAPAKAPAEKQDPDKAVMSQVKKTLGMKQPGRPKGKGPVKAAKKAQFKAKVKK